MAWIKANWRWATLNGLALVIAASLVWWAVQAGDLRQEVRPMVEAGKWAVRFLLLSLSITPLNTLFGWRSAIPLRKPAGLWAFGFGLLHFVFYLGDVGTIWLEFPIPDYMAGLGLAGLLILMPMAATSTRWAMTRLGKWWKRLHHMVYAAGILVAVHGLLEATFAKRVFVVDPQARTEAVIYLVILAALLMARVPPVRARLASLRHRRVSRNAPSRQSTVTG